MISGEVEAIPETAVDAIVHKIPRTFAGYRSLYNCIDDCCSEPAQGSLCPFSVFYAEIELGRCLSKIGNYSVGIK